MTRSLVAACICTMGWTMSVHAQDRMPPIPPGQLTEAQKKAVAEFTAARKADVSGPFVPMLRSPEVMNRARAMGDYLRFNSVLPPRLSEFAILITARQWTQNYEWDAHAPARARGRAVAGHRQCHRAGTPAREDGRRRGDPLHVLRRTASESKRQRSQPTRARSPSSASRASSTSSASPATTRMLAMVLNTARTPVPAGRTPALAPFPR